MLLNAVNISPRTRLLALFGFAIISIILVGGSIFILSGFQPRIEYLIDNEWRLEVILPNNTQIEYSIPELAELEYIEQYYLLFRGGGDKEDQEGVFKGVSIKYLLQEILGLQNYTSVSFQSIDSYAASMNEDEINSEEAIIIAYMKDERYLQGPMEGGDGPLRLIVPQRFEGDTNALRCVKYLNKLVVYE